MLFRYFLSHSSSLFFNAFVLTTWNYDMKMGIFVDNSKSEATNVSFIAASHHFFFCVITYGLANLTKNSIITVHMLLLLPVVLLRYSFNASIITIFSLSKFSSTTVARIFFNFMPSCVFKDQMQTHKYISTF